MTGRDVTTQRQQRPKLAESMALRRRNILNAAVELFERQGYLGTTMDDVAARASVTKRTLYHHVGSKENLLSEIHFAFIDEGLRRWQAVVARDASATEALGDLIAEHIRIVALHRRAITVFFEEAKHLNESSRREIATQRDDYEGILRAVVARGVDTGEFRATLDVNVTTMLILGGLTEMYRWFRPHSRAAEGATIARITATTLSGLTAA